MENVLSLQKRNTALLNENKHEHTCPCLLFLFFLNTSQPCKYCWPCDFDGHIY